MQLPGHRFPLGQMPPEPTKAELLRQAGEHAEEMAQHIEDLAGFVAEGSCSASKAAKAADQWLGMLDDAEMDYPHCWSHLVADLDDLAKLLDKWEARTDQMCRQWPAKAQVA